jgi:hypothetical protein
MSKSDVLLGLIKEVVKNEVKQQVKEEIVRLVKSGVITLNNSKPKPTTPSLKEAITIDPFEKANQALQNSRKVTPTQKPQKEFTKNPMLNEVLNMTQPFTSAHRAEGMSNGMVGGSILDTIQPEKSMEEDWETLSYSNANMPSHQLPSTDNAGVDVLAKALTRDYSELVKRF